MSDKNESVKFPTELKFPLMFFSILWAVKIIELILGVSFVKYGLFPGDFAGLLGVLTYPLIHGDIGHLLSNSLPVLFLASGLFYFYPNSSKKVFAALYFVPGILMWFFARPSYHIGASGIIYGLASFIFFSGVIRRDRRSIVLSLLVTFIYGGLAIGVLPVSEGISWEGHLFGAITGLIASIIFRNFDPYKKDKYDNDDNDDYDVRKLEVSYKKGYPGE
ncbi:MAG: rhomboid family intramembrane serine protease [Melioribacteraceae bacterium]|nr:rhomboid family intramembrane serine protease [Melioribacteraceae bacterium]